MRAWMLMVLLGVAGLMIGCTTRSTPTEVIKDGAVYEVRAHSLDLNNMVRLTRRTVERNQNGFVRAQVEALNLTTRDVQFQYRFRWLDDQKFLVDSAMAIWKPFSLGGKSTEFLSATAPTVNASDFYLEVRFVHTSARW